MTKGTGIAHNDWSAEHALFLRYLDGDPQATRALFSNLQRVISGFYRARMVGGSAADAEDLTQATLLKIHLARDRYEPRQSLKTWVFTIASRSLIDHWRGASYEKEAFLDPYPPETDFPDGQSLLELAPTELLDPERKTELHRDLNQALLKLKPMERSIVYLYGVEGMSMAEVGEVLSITEGAAKLRAHRAYRELRKYLGCFLVFTLFQSGLLQGLFVPNLR